MFKSNLKRYLIPGAILIVGIVLAFLLGSSGKNQAYQLGLERGRKEVEQKYQKKIEEVFPSVPEPEEIFSVFGKIVEIKDRTLILEETRYPASPLEEPEVKKWQVKVVDSTQLVKRVEKTPEELAAQEETLEEPSVPFKETGIEFSDLKIGQEVTAESEQNIKGKTEFEAKKIISQPPL